MPLAAQTSSIRITRSGQRLSVRPAVNILGALRAAAVMTRPDDVVRSRRIPLFDCVAVASGAHRLVCWAGLEPAVVELLTYAGHPSVIDGGGRDHLPGPDMHRVATHVPADFAMIAWCRVHDRGLIRVDRRVVTPARIVGQVAVAWPRLRILVLVRRRDEGQWICDGLRAYTPSVELLTGRDPFRTDGRITVATPTSLGMMAMDRIDLVVVPDVLDGLRPIMLDRIGGAPRARLIGILERGARLSPLERDILAAVYGFGELAIPRPGYLHRRVEVEMTTIKGGPEMASSLIDIEVKRQGIWQHPVRNRRIARLARAIATGDPESAFVGRINHPCRQGRVIILVESLDHTVALGRHLRDWLIVTGDDPCRSDLPAGARHALRRVDQVDPMMLSPAIVTATAAETLDITHIDVVVRADGGVGMPPLPLPTCLDVPWWRARPLRLVDFVDRHHPRLRAWSRVRQSAYASAEWFSIGADPTASRVQQFLERRPGLRGT